ncbi:MAG: hypothetical protein ACD_44C00387G0003 [uncultured bacterium]|nr:MAG: hypothetical protein ACD_44C00387G0003 [uncultured bacterium]OGT23208.1 MAG: endonuclease III [Gammaproteobacteria bacterium RIFCSPHIGHO2_12_38_15]OGT68239.1 MAG: endonuclease III [Gammaproteobacteria bacterium RIFCSPLOWO2_02_FULL_38_11]OGT76196.1 MAG: endonuclease III [Gammaproteobacteria bacterium RIFCSPLOWO2_12_FULL_38_14]
MNKRKIFEIFHRFQSAMPHPKTELHYFSDFELLVAVILSAQSTDKSVNRATKGLFSVANTPEAILKLGIEKLKEKIKTIGLYNTKAKNIMASCQLLVARYVSKVPSTRSLLESLPGVGRKTANVLLNTLFAEPVIAVDTHIFRVANRIGLAHEKTPLAVEKKLMKVIPCEFIHDAHHWLVLHGRYVCVARKPKCGSCLIADLCEYKEKNV